MSKTINNDYIYSLQFSDACVLHLLSTFRIFKMSPTKVEAEQDNYSKRVTVYATNRAGKESSYRYFQSPPCYEAFKKMLLESYKDLPFYESDQ